MFTRYLIAFCALTLGLSWGMGTFGLLVWRAAAPFYWPEAQPSVLAFAAGFVPANAAIFVVLWSKGWPGLKSLLAGLLRWRFHAGYYALICAGVPLLAVTGAWLAGGRMGGGFEGWTSALPLLAILFSPAVLGEELGWRGFALPRLQGHMSSFAASLVTGALAAASQAWWFAISGLSQSVSPLLTACWIWLSVSVLATWLFNSTGGSLLATTLLRLSLALSLAWSGIPNEVMAVLLSLLAAVVIILSGPRLISVWSRQQPALPA